MQWPCVGHQVAMKWPCSGHGVAMKVATQWQCSGHEMAMQWFRSGHAFISLLGYFLLCQCLDEENLTTR
eukprot:5539914-Lingulodinium_polyedra.AAC.1